MGQPAEHSLRVALLAARLVDALELTPMTRAAVGRLALLRWAGCTSNAPEFAELFGDDIAGRAALLAGQNPFVAAVASEPASLHDTIDSLAAMHCETGTVIARQLDLGPEVAVAMTDLFERWDGTGHPGRKRGEAVDLHAQLVTIAGDLEVWTRTYGLPRALTLVEAAAHGRFDPALVRVVLLHAVDWLRDVAALDPWPAASAAAELAICSGADLQPEEIARLLGDYADLKTPTRGQVGRRARAIVEAAAADLDQQEQALLGRAALVHGLGRVSIPNRLLLGRPEEARAHSQALRLIPYWTERILDRCSPLRREAGLAGLVWERVDGSGFYRGLQAATLSPAARLLAAAILAAEIMAATDDNGDSVKIAADALARAAEAGALDRNAARRVSQALGAGRPHATASGTESQITSREQDVLVLVARGRSNKEIARQLGISPSTTGTHVESLYRKLGVASRAAATLKALEAGLLA